MPPDLTPAALPRVAGGAGCTDEQVCAYFQTSVDGVTSFDNIGWSFIVIMQAVTFDTCLAPSYAAMATVTPYAWAYFFVLAMVGGFFVVNLFLAVIFDEFLKAKEVNMAAAAEEKRAAEVAAEEAGAPKPADDPKNGDASASLLEGGGGGSSGGCCDCAPGAAGWRRALADIVTSDWFGNGSTALVILNMMVMCCPYAGQTEAWAAQVEGAATVITVLFMIEMALKLVGLGCKGYWEDGWNQLDGCADEPTPNISQHLLQTARARATEQSCFSRQST